jgi:hypothetical protein
MRPFLPPVPPLALQVLLGALANQPLVNRVLPSRVVPSRVLPSRVVPS